MHNLATQNEENTIQIGATSAPSASMYTARPAATKVDTIIVHYSINYTMTNIHADLLNKKLYCNYIIDSTGEIYEFVSKTNAAKFVRLHNKKNSVDVHERTMTDDEALKLDNRSISIVLAAGQVYPHAISAAVQDSLATLLEYICNTFEINELVWASDRSKRIDKHITDDEEIPSIDEAAYNILLFSDVPNTLIEPGTKYDPTYTTPVWQTIDGKLEKREVIAYRIPIDGVVGEAAKTATDNIKFAQFEDDDVPDGSREGIGGGGFNNQVSGNLISKADLPTVDEYLTRSQMEPVARYVWQYLGSAGWSLNAVAAVCGNMERESTLNPNLKERPLSSWTETGKGFGLVQWTGANKLKNWCINHKKLVVPDGVDPYTLIDIDLQLERIIYELENGEQWNNGAYTDVSMTFEEFSTSVEPVADLTEIFMRKYEQPGNQEYVDDGSGKTPLQKRKEWAQEWYDYLVQFSLVSLPTAYGLHLTSLKPDCLTAKCFIQNAATNLELVLYVVGTDNKVVNHALKVVEANTESVTFEVDTLKPDTTYSLALTVATASNPDTGADPSTTQVRILEEVKISETGSAITFKTPKGYPNPVKGVQLLRQGLPLPDQTFTLLIEPPDDWGYTVNNNPGARKGYVIQLFVNGVKVAKRGETDIDACRSFSIRLDSSSYFTASTAKPGDSVQVCVCTWVDVGEILYSSVKASNSICMINKEHYVFLPDALQKS